MLFRAARVVLLLCALSALGGCATLAAVQSETYLHDPAMPPGAAGELWQVNHQTHGWRVTLFERRF